MTNEQRLLPFYKKLYDKLKLEDFVIDKTGVKMVEIIGENLIFDPKQPYLDFGVRKSPKEYIEREINWYKSTDLNIKNWVDDIAIWKQVADEFGYINSNYGWMIYSSANFNQYQRCLKELINNKESRRAVMIYQRPGMWLEYNSFGKNDFCCTDGIQCFIRNNKLIYIIKQRSQDAIYGAFGDLAWHAFVYIELFNDLIKVYNNLEISEILHYPFSFHIYEKHFYMLEQMVENFNE